MFRLYSFDPVICALEERSKENHVCRRLEDLRPFDVGPLSIDHRLSAARHAIQSRKSVAKLLQNVEHGGTSMMQYPARLMLNMLTSVRLNLRLRSCFRSKRSLYLGEFLYSYHLNSNKAVKSSWGNRINFQASYGLKTTQEDYKKEKEVLKALEKAEKKTANKRAK